MNLVILDYKELVSDFLTSVWWKSSKVNLNYSMRWLGKAAGPESLLETRVKNILTTFTNWKQTDGMMYLNGSVDMYIDTWFKVYLAFPGDSDGKESSCNAGRDRLPTPLAWRIPWAKEPGRLQPTGYDWETNTFIFMLPTTCQWKVLPEFLLNLENRR